MKLAHRVMIPKTNSSRQVLFTHTAQSVTATKQATQPVPLVLTQTSTQMLITTGPVNLAVIVLQTVLNATSRMVIATYATLILNSIIVV
jgi:hypothetical protein